VTHIALEPLLPLGVIALLLIIPTMVIAFNLILRRRGAVLRAATLVVFAAVLLGPVLVREEREPTKATIALIVDRSQSQRLGNRQEQSDAILMQLESQLSQLSQFDVRLIEVTSSSETANATHLFAPLQQAFADVPPAQQGGAIIITDGQIHDLPSSLSQLGISAPINALITGHTQEYDRQISITTAPRFALVGERVKIGFRIEDLGVIPEPLPVIDVTLSVNGEILTRRRILSTAPENFEFIVPLPVAGNNIIELTTPLIEGELSEVNNRVAVVIDGVRENLKTLLVSGEPHNGLRIWRDLLKSDTGVDLIHFTILRPPEKFDNTPSHELSLISFPTTELFVDKIDEFDLIILDRYQHYDILPLIYYDYIAEYVKNGGALLLVAGPEYADEMVSLADTPLVSALPARPTGTLLEQPFLPHLSEIGKKHPVTRDLEGAQREPPEWGRWLRQIEVGNIDADTRILLNGVDDKPLMLLGQKGEGRIGMLLSDQGWLWGRGFEGGGPIAQLYRRMTYWLLKQPELEEETLRTKVSGGRILIERQTMGDEESLIHVKMTSPSGIQQEQQLTKIAAGLLTGSFTIDEPGLFRIENGDKTSFALIGSLDAPEWTQLLSTAAKIEDVIKLSGGNVMRVSNRADDDVTVPPLQIVDEGRRSAADKLILWQSRDSRLLRVNTLPLYSAFWVLLIILTLLGMSWRRESR